MAASTRQSNLFAAEDWKKVYETFREADFQSYDYETIRKSMVEYIRNYYPEDFNDFIESSEYVALIDLIAFLGQSLSFRADLNARENFLETAERRDSILRLARMLNYYPKRNQIARGLLKIVSLRTTEEISDSNGNNLRDVEVEWADITNTDFLEQFTTIINAALVSTQKYGNPALKTTIGGVNVEEYQIKLQNSTIPIYDFQSTVGSQSLDFELVKGTYSGTDYLYEVPPAPSSTYTIQYRNDNRGFSSANNGFFCYFKQGSLQSADFTIEEKLPNRIVDIDINNIDDNDVWLYKLDDQGRESTRWTKVPAISGNNVIYNSLSNKNKDLFTVRSRANDQISLVFGDDVFSNIPVGDYRVYFRVGAGTTYKISPNDMKNITVNIPYISHANQIENLVLTLSLQTTVANASARENLADVKIKAQQQYYTQDRMITGEDYQILPYTKFNNILKAKAINRTASGISRYLDVRDTTGKYSSTNIVAEDGIFYRTEDLQQFQFTFVTKSDINNTISTQVERNILKNSSLHFYYKNYGGISVTGLSASWNLTTTTSGSCTGYFKNDVNSPLKIGDFASSNLKYAKVGALVKFTAPSGKVFDINNNLIDGTSGTINTRDFIWASLSQVVTDGTNQGVGNLETGVGPVTLSEVIPQDAILDQIIANWNTTISSTTRSAIIDAISDYKTFGIRFDRDTQQWIIIDALNLDQATTFSLVHAGNTSNTGLDNSWFFKFTNDGSTYTVNFRDTSYIFESKLETRFYFDNDLKIFDPRTGKTIRDKINILKVNSLPDSNSSLAVDYAMQVDDVITETDGYTLTNRIKVTFPDTDSDGVVDNPEIFDIVVAPNTNSSTKVVFYQTSTANGGYLTYTPVATTSVEQRYTTRAAINEVLAQFGSGQVFYASAEDTFYTLSISGANVKSIAQSTDYVKRIGRSDLLFQYTHNSPNNRRIDPSPSNITDLFLLTSQYDRDYRNYIVDLSGSITKPVKPTTNDLRDQYGSLEQYKSVSDTIIFNSITYRPLFGDKAEEELQASFKVVKNNSTLISDSEIKERVIVAINEYFAIENWDFGDTFYFSELSAYLYNVLSPNVLSIVIVPKLATSNFGSLFQIQSQRDEILISAATVNDIEVIDVITANSLQASGNVVNTTSTNLSAESASANGSNTSVNTSTNTTTTSTTTSISSSTGGYSY
jgi:hypothetical protein